MAEHDDDLEVSRRYRELGSEEPPHALDAAILAEARRAVAAHPAPLVPPTGRQRWYFPVAAAAIIVLAVAVTLQVERQQPDPEALSPSQPPAAAAPAALPKAIQEKDSPAPEMRRKETPTKPLRQSAPKSEPPPAVAAAKPAEPQAAAPSSSTADALERRDIASNRQEAASAAGAPAARSAVQARALAKVESPEQALERIAVLRREGRDEEADQALKDFRKRYPDYKISDEMMKRVERQ